jgi:hypothetical protein
MPNISIQLQFLKIDLNSPIPFASNADVTFQRLAISISLTLNRTIVNH